MNIQRDLITCYAGILFYFISFFMMIIEYKSEGHHGEHILHNQDGNRECVFIPVQSLQFPLLQELVFQIIVHSFCKAVGLVY